MLDASCLHPLLDMQCAPVRPVGYYAHRMFQGNVRQESRDVLYNDEIDPTKVFQFLCSSEQIVTSSYHGTLWAVYFGKAVAVTDAFSEKFEMLPFVVSRDPANPTRIVDGAQIRDKCRAENMQFYETYVKHSVRRISNNT